MSTATVAGSSTAQIHAAAASVGAGGTVRFPNGEYESDGLQVQYARQTWELERDAVLKRTATATGPIVNLLANGWRLNGGTLDGNRSGNSSAAAGVDGTGFSFDMRDFTMKSVNGWGIAVDNCPMTLLDFTITDTLNAPIIWRNTATLTMEGPLIERGTIDRTAENPTTIASGGILVQAAAGKWVMRPRILNCKVLMPWSFAYGAVGIEIANSQYAQTALNVLSSGRIGISYANASFGQMSNNIVQASTNYCLEIADHSYESVASNNVCCGASGTTLYGMSISGATVNTSVMANKFRFCGAKVQIGSDCTGTFEYNL